MNGRWQFGTGITHADFVHMLASHTVFDLELMAAEAGQRLLA